MPATKDYEGDQISIEVFYKGQKWDFGKLNEENDQNKLFPDWINFINEENLVI